MHFWIDIKFIKYLGQFKQNDICTFVHDMKFQKKNYHLRFNFYKL
jgi:hypothetical protein